MSELGQSRRLGPPPMTSGLPPEADTVTDGRHVSKVPDPGMDRDAEPLLPAVRRLSNFCQSSLN